MEAFDFAVGLGPVWASAFVADAGRVQRLFPGMGSVAGTVVGQDALDMGDALGGEPCLRSVPERGGGCFGFVGQDFGVGQPAVIVEGGVKVGIAEIGAAACGAWFAGITVCGAVAPPMVLPWTLWPPPSGMLPSFLMSTCTMPPGRSYS